MTSPFRSLLHKLFGVTPVRTYHNPRKGRAKRAITFRPCFQALEDRVVPTSTWYQVTGLADGDPNSFLSRGNGTQADPFLFGNLRGAIMNANTDHPVSLPGETDTITFDPSLFTSGAQTINLSAIQPNLSSTKGRTDLAISTDITIIGPNNIGPNGAYGLTLNNTASGQRLFYVATTASLTLANLTLTGGDAKGSNGGLGGGGGGAGMGGAIFNDGELTLNACTLTGNTAIGGSGGAGWGGNGQLAHDGGAGSFGGGFGIFATTGGVGGAGGAAYANGGGAGGAGGTGGIGGFGSGGGGGGGGGGGSVTANGTGSFPGGAGGQGGDGGFGGGGGGGGGGGYNGAGGKQPDGGGGTGGYGGGNGGGGAFIGGGGGAGMGGAIFNNGYGTVTITNCTLTGNSASGGAPGHANGGALAVHSQGLGGAIFNVNGTVNVYDSTISGNTAAQGGTGIFSVGYGPFLAHLNVYSSIVATAGSSTDFEAVGANGGFTVTNDLEACPNLLANGQSIDPKLGPLADNGGPTRTMMPALDSPAINAGDTSLLPGSVTTDQRGLLRLRGPQLDLGAVQIQHFNQTITFDALNIAFHQFGDAPFPVSASSSSGLPVTLRIVGGDPYASISGDPINGYKITILHATPLGAKVTVEATQSGNAVYNAAAAVDQSFIIFPTVQHITFSPVANQTYGNAPFVVSASSTSGLPVTLSIVAGSQYALIGGVTGGTIAVIGATPAGAVVTIRAGQAGSLDYLAAGVDQSFTVAQATPTVNVTDNGGTYSGSAYAATAASVTGVLWDGTLASLGSSTLSYRYYAGTLTTAAQVAGATALPGAPINVGAYTVVAHYTSNNGNYTDADSAPVNFSIIKAASTTTTIGAGPFTYDTTIHAGGSGTVTGPNGFSASATLTYSANPDGTGVPDFINAGTYYVTAHYAGDANHLPSDGAAVAVTILKASSTTTVSDASGPYSGSAFEATSTVSGVGNITGGASIYYFPASDTTFSHPLSGAPVNAGSYFALAKYPGDANHTGSSDVVDFTIEKASSTTTTVGAGPFTYTGSAQIGGSGTVTGAGGLSTGATSLTYSANPDGTGVPDFINAGTYYVTAHYAGDANHTASDGDPVAITVTPAHLTVTAVDQSRLYGQANPTLTYQITGFVNNENATLAGITGTPVLETSATPTSPVAGSPYTITIDVSDVSAANYDFTAVNGNLTINKAHLTVTANNVTKIIGAANPQLTVTITGYVNGQNATTAGVSGSAVLSTTATASSSVGSYSITVSLGTLNATNYDFRTFVPGTLSVTYGIRSELPRIVSRPRPFKIQLTNAAGRNISSAKISVTVVGMASAATPDLILPATSLGRANPNNRFRLVGETYTFLLATTGLTPGSYLLYFTAGKDPIRHALEFTYR